MVNKKDDWHHERRIGEAVKAGIKCFCGGEAYRDILEVTMNGEVFPRVHRIFCPNCGLQMRAPTGNDDDFIVRQWRDMLKAQEPQATTHEAEWHIFKGRRGATCSYCKYTFDDVYDPENYDYYCRHCGARMVRIRAVKWDA